MVRRVISGIAVAVLLAGAPASCVPLLPGFSSASAQEVSRLGVEATELAFKGKFTEAGDMAARSGSVAAQKLVELLYLRDHWKNAGYARIMTFLVQAPKWPLTETLMKHAERALYVDRHSAAEILQHFASRKPTTPEGRIALARAQLASGDAGAARATIGKLWIEDNLDAGLERTVLTEFGAMLSTEHHRQRTAHLIYAQETNSAIRAAKYAGGVYPQAAKVAQALMRSAGGAEKQYSALPAAAKQLLPVKYALARYYRKADKDSKARAILASIPADHAITGDGEAWWIERRIVARKSIGPGRSGTWQAAYNLARSHGFSSGQFLVEGEFLAGWIALRSLKDPQTALKHFVRLREGAETRTDKARANYWLGRAYAALGEDGKAQAAWRTAAQTATVYYGQLAREQLGLAKEPISLGSGQASAAAKARVANDEVMQAFRLVAAAGRKRELNSFLWSISSRFKSVDELNAAGAVAWDLGGPAVAVRLAKLAGQKGYDIDYWAYPVKAMPNWATIGKSIERPLVYGLSRQESEFDPAAGSGAGARGLMQLMPGTAKLIAKQYGLPYAPAKLTGDPAYNVKLGAAHLADLVEDFNGSYVLTLAGYNAGPRRSREWVAAYGDPRGGQVDAIDWVESIPFSETRTYVQKVLQNTHIYRSKLAPDTMRAMSSDLKRGSPSAIAVADSAGTSSGQCESGVIGSITSLIKGCD